MEQPRFGGPLNSPPFFYGSNYPHWNAQINFFLKVQGEMVWNLVEYGWGPALKLDVNRKSTGELKPKQEWEKLDNDGSEANVWAFFSIFNRVSPD